MNPFEKYKSLISFYKECIESVLSRDGVACLNELTKLVLLHDNFGLKIEQYIHTSKDLSDIVGNFYARTVPFSEFVSIHNKIKLQQLESAEAKQLVEEREAKIKRDIQSFVPEFDSFAEQLTDFFSQNSDVVLNEEKIQKINEQLINWIASFSNNLALYLLKYNQDQAVASMSNEAAEVELVVDAPINQEMRNFLFKNPQTTHLCTELDKIFIQVAKSGSTELLGIFNEHFGTIIGKQKQTPSVNLLTQFFKAATVTISGERPKQTKAALAVLASIKDAIIKMPDTTADMTTGSSSSSSAEPVMESGSFGP